MGYVIQWLYKIEGEHGSSQRLVACRLCEVVSRMKGHATCEGFLKMDLPLAGSYGATMVGSMQLLGIGDFDFEKYVQALRTVSQGLFTCPRTVM